jgi:hypothetical protein
MHHSHTIQEAIKGVNSLCLFNAPYSSEYHCIEEYYSLVKRSYRKAMLREGFQISNSMHRMTISKAIESVDTSTTRKIIAGT